MSVSILEGVDVSFNKSVKVLSNINLAVRRGEVLIVIGPSGVGKTTLLKTMVGLISPSAGRVQRDVNLTLGMVFQKNALFDSLTVFENLAFSLRETSTLNELEVKERVENILKEVELSHVLNLFPGEISGGMQKRLAIARTLVLNPLFILYDDPTAGLDPVTGKVILEVILRSKNKFNSTVVIVTNDMKWAFRVGTQIALLMEGRLINLGSPKEAKEYPDSRVQKFLRGEGDFLDVS